MKQIALALACVSFLAMPQAHAMEWLGGSEGELLGNLYITSEGHLRIYNTTGDWGGSMCTDQSNVILLGTTKGFDTMYSALLAALVANKRVSIQVSTCGNTNQAYAAVVKISN